MQQLAIFIDGPLAQECMTIVGLPPTYKVPLPKRTTICNCDIGWPYEANYRAEIFQYNRIMTGDGVALYSKYEHSEDIIHSLKEWVATDLINTDKMVNYCNDRRAFE